MKRQDPPLSLSRPLEGAAGHFRSCIDGRSQAPEWKSRSSVPSAREKVFFFFSFSLFLSFFQRVLLFMRWIRQTLGCLNLPHLGPHTLFLEFSQDGVALLGVDSVHCVD